MPSVAFTFRPVGRGARVNPCTGVALRPSQYGWTIFTPSTKDPDGMEAVQSECHYRVAYRLAKSWAAECLARRDRDHAEAIEINADRTEN